MTILERLECELSSLPGIGRRSARRLLFHFLSSTEENFHQFMRALKETREKIRPCLDCFHYAEEDLCKICSSVRRDKSILCVVEKSQDVYAIEDSQSYFGTYHVLGGVISPLEGIGPDHLNIKELVDRIEKGTYREVILALNSSMESEATRLYVRSLIENKIKVSELARGIPAGGELEYVDRGTIQKALMERRDFR